uniref:Uncharacterized protein n=1 Tax=viral metagenome TaxID=1070528 RepID=A0A6C0E8G5_9ZZZZ
MGTQTHTRSNNKGRKVSQKKKLLTGGSDGYTDPEPSTSQEELNKSGEYEITQSGGAYANITKYKYRNSTHPHYITPLSMMITFKAGENLDTIKGGNDRMFFINGSRMNDGNQLNTAYINTNPKGLSIRSIYDMLANLPIHTKDGFAITGTNNRDDLSACLMTDLISPEILDKVDNIYLANQANNDYENADYETNTTAQLDQENRYNVIILPFTVLKQNARQAAPAPAPAPAPALPNIVENKVCVYLLSHYIGAGTISMHNLINNNAGAHNIEDGKFFHTDPTNASPTPHIAWRPFFCNYNHHTRILNGFINQEDPAAPAPINGTPGACSGIIRTRKCDETIPVAKNILYHILESTCNPNKKTNDGNSIPSYVAAAVADATVRAAITAAGTYKQKCNAISDIVKNANLDTTINANTFIDKIKKVAGAGERNTNTAPRNPPYGRAISIETYTIPNCGVYNNLNSSEGTAPNPAGNTSKLFPQNKKVMVISFMVDVDPTNLASEFPIVEYAAAGEYLFNEAQNRPLDGQIAWVPIAEIVSPVATPGHTTCVKLNSSTGANHPHHNDGGGGGAAGAHVCTPHTANATPLGNTQSCQNMETPYEWFLHLVNSDAPGAAAANGQKLPKILKDTDGFKIHLTAPAAADANTGHATP